MSGPWLRGNLAAPRFRRRGPSPIVRRSLVIRSGLDGVTVAAGGAGLVVSLAIGSWLPSVLGVLAAVIIGLARRDHAIERRGRARREAIRSTLSRIDASARAGTALGPAVQAACAGPATEHPHLLAVGTRLERGFPLAQALDIESTDRDESLDLVLVTLSVLAGRGGPATAALSRLLDVIDALDAAAADERAASAQVRASALVLVCLPVAFAALGASVDAEIRSVFLDRPIGALCVAVAGGLDLLGWRWTRRLVAA